MNKRQKRYRIGLAFLMLLLIWQIIAMRLHNDILIPYPIDVVKIMLNQISSDTFYSILFHTLIRAFSGFFIALALALLLAFLAYFRPWFEDICYPFILLTRSVPNISYIIIVLFWFSSETSVIVISFLVLFPTMYATLIQGLKTMPNTLLDVMRIYPAPCKVTIPKIYLPYLRPYIIASTSAGISLAFKVGIMAEILGQVSIGIGRQLNISRLQLDMTSVFAWTIWIILALFLIEKGFAFMEQRVNK